MVKSCVSGFIAHETFVHVYLYIRGGTLYDGMMIIYLLEVLPHDESSVNSLAN